MSRRTESKPPFVTLAQQLEAIRLKTVEAQQLAVSIAKYGEGIPSPARHLLAQRMTDHMVTACNALIEWETIARREANRTVIRNRL